MLYRLLKIPASISFWMYCRRLRVNDKSVFQSKGPLLIACNHPNSFLDAIVLSSLFKRPVYSLARGDVFKNKFIAMLLRSLNMLPVYRSSEGVQNMEHNYTSFEACKNIFRKNGIVLIFSEGSCVNEWKLRPLMKGTARLAISSWGDGIPSQVLPTGINYQSFTRFGKNIHLNFGKIFSENEVDSTNGFGKSISSFNEELTARLKPLVYVIDKKDDAALRKKFAIRINRLTKALLAIPAGLGYLLHLPLTYPAKKIASKLGGHNDHYDSMLVGFLFLTYPLYLLMTAALLHKFASPFWLPALILIPLTGYCYMLIKKQF